MPPTTASITGHLQQMIYYHLDNLLFHNALFLSERLGACEKSGDSTYLVSLCHLRLGDNRSALDCSRIYATKQSAHLGCAYIYAQANLALTNYKDGIFALEKCRLLWLPRSSMGKHTSMRRDVIPDAAAMNCLLGKLYLAAGDKRSAIRCFEDSLRVNPFMWDAFVGLCDMGCRIRCSSIFKINHEMEEMLRPTTTLHDTSQVRKTGDGPHENPAATERSQNRNITKNVNPTIGDGTDPFSGGSSRGTGNTLFGTHALTQRSTEEYHFRSGTHEAPHATLSRHGVADTAVGISQGAELGVAPSASSEQSQAPTRSKNRMPHYANGDAGDPVPRTNRAVSTKRLGRQEAAHDEQFVNGRGSALAQAGERKRTISGQVVPPRIPHGQSEETGVPRAPERRSVRLLNQFTDRVGGTLSRASSSRLGNSNHGTASVRDFKEVKKLRPPIGKTSRPHTTTSTVGRVVSGNRKPTEDVMDVDLKDYRPSQLHHANTMPMTTSRINAAQLTDLFRQDSEALQWLLELMKKLGIGHYSLSQYHCEEALRVFETLPQAQQETAWVMAMRGRVYYEQADYKNAEIWFKKLSVIAPTRVQDMEIYSTVLWHLKRETELSFLSHELTDTHWQSPQAWCAAGNAMSLSRDHEQALKCFKRATQIDPTFAYAYTLQGHEHCVNEEFDKALSAYRQGVGADKRLYNAYYGIGRVHERLGDLKQAFQNFDVASSINPTNAVLFCCMGTILEKQKNPRQALDYFTRASELSPASPLARFKKAKALMALNELHVALQELIVLKDMAPDEAMVHFLLGKVYKGLRQKSSAVKHFTISLNLDPKASHQIKEALESLEVDDQEHDGDGDSMMG